MVGSVSFGGLLGFRAQGLGVRIFEFRVPGFYGWFCEFWRALRV